MLLELLHINFPISQESNPCTLLISSQVNPCWNILDGIPLRENCRSLFSGFLFRIFPHWDLMQSNCGKIRTTKTPNTDTSYAVSTEKFSNTVLNLSTNTFFFYCFDNNSIIYCSTTLRAKLVIQLINNCVIIPGMSGNYYFLYLYTIKPIGSNTTYDAIQTYFIRY